MIDEGAMHAMTPSTPLADGEVIVASFRPDKATYWRDHAWMAAVAMAAGMAVLWAIGNPHVWAGAVGGLSAIAVRAFYLASDELAVRWDLTDRRLLGPQTRAMRLGEVETVRRLGSTVQIITRGGDKHLLKYQADGAATKAKLERSIAGGRG